MFENNIIEDFPAFFEVNFKAINKNYFKVISLNTLLTLLIILSIVTIFLYFKNQDYSIYFIVHSGLIFLFSLIQLYAYIGFSKRKYLIRQQDISYKKGVLISSTTTVPFNRIQHIEISEGYFSRQFKLASLNIYTAGANGKDLVIRGLSKEKALEIKEIITKSING